MVKEKPASARDYADYLCKLFGTAEDGDFRVSRGVTFQITGDCTLRCSYCYENHKSCQSMTLETGKKSLTTFWTCMKRTMAILFARKPRESSSISSVGSLCFRLSSSKRYATTSSRNAGENISRSLHFRASPLPQTVNSGSHPKHNICSENTTI